MGQCLVRTQSFNMCYNKTDVVVLAVDEDHCHRDSGHSQVDKRARRKLITASILCLIFMVVEVIGKWLLWS